MKSKKVAKLIPYNGAKKVLLQHRSDDAPIFPGFWSIFGGEIEKDETPLEAVIREAYEEIEYKLTDPQLLNVTEYLIESTNEITHIYTERFDESQKIVLHEGQAYGWFTIEEALKLKIADHRRKDLLKMQEFLAKL